MRPDLYDDLETFKGSRLARKAEIARAVELAGSGFVAHCDGTSYGRDSADWEEWGKERLERVAAHVDAAASELAESAFEPLDTTDCARLLHGDRGFWVADFIESADPPPAYGLFAHVRLEVLVDRIGSVVTPGGRH